MITSLHLNPLLILRNLPLLGSIFSFFFFFFLLVVFKFRIRKIFFCSIIILVIFIYTWWAQLDYSLSGGDNRIYEDGVKVAIGLFISSEVFFFFSFFWSYFHYFFFPSIECGLVWPPQNVDAFDWEGAPMINTLILISSRISITIAHNYLIESKKFFWFNFFFFVTYILGLIFRVYQYIEYSESFFGVNDRVYGTSFFFLTGFHGFHVLAGSLFLLFSHQKCLYCNASKFGAVSLEISAWYWHFVDFVWIFLFFFLYYLRA